MKMRVRPQALQPLACSLLLVGLVTSAQAQIGTGWTSYTAGRARDLDGTGTYSSANGVETFKIGATVSSYKDRSENKITNTYTSGQRQFEGQMKIASLGGTGVCVKQTFKSPDVGPFHMLTVKSDSGGSLYDHGNTAAGSFMTSVVGKTIRVNTIHDMNADTHKLYLNGALKDTRATGTHSSWFDKYGCYRTNSGRGPATVQWWSIKLWRK